MNQTTLGDHGEEASEDTTPDREGGGGTVRDDPRLKNPYTDLDPLPIEESEYEPDVSAWSVEDMMEVPTPPPHEIGSPGDPPSNGDSEELRKAVDSMLEATDDAFQPKHARIGELPRWLDEADIPSATSHGTAGMRPEYCTHCGVRDPCDRPLEQGRVLALEGDDGNPAYDPCPSGKYNLRRCECCGCPACGAKSIRFRKTKSPDYACGNPNCKVEFSHPVERPFDPAMPGARERLFWECKNCGEPTLASFKGIPDKRI